MSSSPDRTARTASRRPAATSSWSRRATGGRPPPGTGRQRRRSTSRLAPSPPPQEWRFAHLSDTHVHAGNVDRMRRALALAQSREPDFAVVTGDLNKDALRVDEATARGAWSSTRARPRRRRCRVRSVPGNHDIFGIERHLSLVPATNPVYGKVLYEQTLGPRYYSFDRGRIHFVVLDTLGIDDLWYYGLLEEDELALAAQGPRARGARHDGRHGRPRAVRTGHFSAEYVGRRAGAHDDDGQGRDVLPARRPQRAGPLGDPEALPLDPGDAGAPARRQSACDSRTAGSPASTPRRPWTTSRTRPSAERPVSSTPCAATRSTTASS